MTADWISIKETFPPTTEIDEFILVVGRAHDENTAKVFSVFHEEKGEFWCPTGDVYTDGGIDIKDVTHWMNLPDAPTKEEK